MIILREHELTDEEYSTVYNRAAEICEGAGVPLAPHSRLFIKSDRIHVKMGTLRNEQEKLKKYRFIGTSVHSPEEAAEAQALGASYIIAGHIFPTDCKKGLPPRGIDYLKAVCDAVHIPVFGIGGIAPENYPEVRRAGAAGACVMSGLMAHDDPAAYISAFDKSI